MAPDFPSYCCSLDIKELYKRKAWHYLWRRHEHQQRQHDYNQDSCIQLNHGVYLSAVPNSLSSRHHLRACNYWFQQHYKLVWALAWILSCALAWILSCALAWILSSCSLYLLRAPAVPRANLIILYSRSVELKCSTSLSRGPEKTHNKKIQTYNRPTPTREPLLLHLVIVSKFLRFLNTRQKHNASINPISRWTVYTKQRRKVTNLLRLDQIIW